MAGKKSSSLDKLLSRMDRLDEAGLRTLAQRLARERALLETVFNTLQEGVLVITADGEIDYANDAAGRLIGFKDEPGQEKTLWRLVPGLRASLEDDVAGGQTAGQPVVTREFELAYPAPRVVRRAGQTRGSRSRPTPRARRAWVRRRSPVARSRRGHFPPAFRDGLRWSR